MKKFANIVLALMMVALFTLATGCSDAEKEDAAQVEQDAEQMLADTRTDLQADAAEVSDEFKVVVDGAIEKVDSMGEVADEDIHRAMDYITEHMDEAAHDSKVAEQVAHYAACLKYWTRGTEHEVSEFADEAYDYAKELYREGESEGEDLIAKAKEELSAAGEKIGEKKDQLVSDICRLIADL